MTDFREHFVKCCGYELHVRAWGDPAKRPLLMMHGLAVWPMTLTMLPRISQINITCCAHQ